MKRVKKDLDFVGYTYKADVEEEKQMFVSALQELHSINESTGYEGGEQEESSDSASLKQAVKPHTYYEEPSKYTSKYENQNYGTKNSKETSSKGVRDENNYDSKKLTTKNPSKYTSKSYK